MMEDGAQQDTALEEGWSRRRREKTFDGELLSELEIGTRGCSAGTGSWEAWGFRRDWTGL
jgi:hypothetical protein